MRAGEVSPSLYILLPAGEMRSALYICSLLLHHDEDEDEQFPFLSFLIFLLHFNALNLWRYGILFILAESDKVHVIRHYCTFTSGEKQT